jgi:hypothetical protein
MVYFLKAKRRTIWLYFMRGREKMATDNEEKFAGMTRTEVLEAAHALSQEFDENDENSKTYSEYIEIMEAGQKALETQKGYYQQEGRADS